MQRHRDESPLRKHQVVGHIWAGDSLHVSWDPSEVLMNIIQYAGWSQQILEARLGLAISPLSLGGKRLIH